MYGPGSHQGCELHNLYTTQVVEHLDDALRHGPYDTMTGELLRGTLVEAMTTELGLPGLPFAYSFKLHFKLITTCLWKDIWQEIEDTPIQLEANTAELPLQRENDRFLMSEFIRHGYRNKGLVRLHRC
jgi:hypothetical protein